MVAEFLRASIDLARVRRAVLRILVPVVIQACVHAQLSAQQLGVPRGNSDSAIIAAAEESGAVYPHVTPAQGSDAAPRKCVFGYEIGPAQSGEFTVGGQLSGLNAMRAGRQGKVWWAPLHYAADMPPLVVRGRSLTTPRDTVWYTTSKIAWPVKPGAPPVPPAERKYFFPSGITIPTSGRWVLVATSGANWGCFVLTVN